MVINWPVSSNTGVVLDDEWFEAGTRVSLTEPERDRVFYALAHGGAEPPDGQLATRQQVREYWRIKMAEQQRSMFLGLGPDLQVAATVRGRGFFEWVDFIDHLKRTGHLIEALTLSVQCMDAAFEYLELGGSASLSRWVERTAIIHRKLGNYAAEVELLEGAIDTLPECEFLRKRLPTAKRLLASSSSQ